MASEDDNPLAGLDVQLESTAEQVAGALREAIIDGGLPQGTYLRENSLSKRFNVSRNTIREATQILVGERLVTRRMHRGAFVSRLGAEDVHDLYRVRRIVELPAVGEVATMDHAAMHATVRAFAQAIEDDDRPGIVAADLQFHSEIVSAMSSDRLGALFESLEGELRLCMALVGGAYPDPAGDAARARGDPRGARCRGPGTCAPAAGRAPRRGRALDLGRARHARGPGPRGRVAVGSPQIAGVRPVQARL